MAENTGPAPPETAPLTVLEVSVLTVIPIRSSQGTPRTIQDLTSASTGVRHALRSTLMAIEDVRRIDERVTQVHQGTPVPHRAHNGTMFMEVLTMRSQMLTTLSYTKRMQNTQKGPPAKPTPASCSCATESVPGLHTRAKRHNKHCNTYETDAQVLSWNANTTSFNLKARQSANTLRRCLA